MEVQNSLMRKKSKEGEQALAELNSIKNNQLIIVCKQNVS